MTDQASSHSLSTQPSEPTPTLDLSPASAEPETLPKPAKKSLWNSVIGSATKMTTSMGSAVGQAGQAMAGAVTDTTCKLGTAASQTSGTIANTAKDVGGAIGTAAANAGQVTVNTVKRVPDGLGQLATMVSDNPQLRLVTKHLKIEDLLCGLIEQVDVVKAEADVQRLKEKHPNDSNYQIAHRIIVKKVMYAGSTGFASSFLPGMAAGLFALDLAATLALQAEMIYQIAAAYGLDLREPARKGEVLAIFGLTLGGNSAFKAGLGFARNIPTVGAVIGASSNAVLIYTLGQAACQFYAAQVNPLDSQEALQASQLENDQYLKDAIAQEVVMDQILVHVIVAGHPDKTWHDLLPDLPKFKFSPASMEAIAACADDPPGLPELLEHITEEFAVPLFIQCQKLANADGIVTPDEHRLLTVIAQTLNLESDGLPLEPDDPLDPMDDKEPVLDATLSAETASQKGFS
jgi:uncharacterized protein (DUF697 family)